MSIDTRNPRILRSSLSASRIRGMPSSVTAPVAFMPGGNMPAIALAVSDFPDPDSPTIAMVSPRLTTMFKDVVMGTAPCAIVSPSTARSGLS